MGQKFWQALAVAFLLAFGTVAQATTTTTTTSTTTTLPATATYNEGEEAKRRALFLLHTFGYTTGGIPFSSLIAEGITTGLYASCDVDVSGPIVQYASIAGPPSSPLLVIKENKSSLCTAATTPYDCCTGSGVGTCQDLTEIAEERGDGGKERFIRCAVWGQ